MKYKSMTAMVNIIILLMVAVLLISCAEAIQEDPLSVTADKDSSAAAGSTQTTSDELATNAETPNEDASASTDELTPEVVGVEPSTTSPTPDQNAEQTDDEKASIPQGEPEVNPLIDFSFTSVDQWLQYQKTAMDSLGDEESNLAQLHREGTVISRKELYYPLALPDVYELAYISQLPNETLFCYRLKNTSSWGELLLTEIHISFTYGEENILEQRESQFGISRDADGYVYVEKYQRIFYELDEGCCMSVYAKAASMQNYQTLRELCKAQMVIIDPTHVTE
ncbi:MAG: hypothetical protein IJW40_11440 [Clostridia bacterium]|nr:hypothetical protein [Clostridia bacterium]